MIQPIDDRLLLQPNDSVMRRGLFIPDTYKDAATTCRVVAKGNKISRFIKSGALVMCRVGFGDRLGNTLEGTRIFWCREQHIYGIWKDNIIYPLGRTVIVRRDIADKHVNGVLIPENRRSQSLDAEITRIGLSEKPFKTKGLKVGMKVRLKEWHESMQAITLEDQSHGLVVREQDLLLSYEA